MKHKLKKEVKPKVGKSILIALMFLMVPCLLYASPGDTLWTRIYGGDGEDDYALGNCVWQTADGGYIIAGRRGMGIDDRQAVLIKTNANGDTTWTRKYGDGLEDTDGYEANSIRQTADGGYILAGYCGIGTTEREAYLMKTDEFGDSTWTCRYGDSHHAKCVQQTTDGGYVITGDNNPDNDEIPLIAFLVKTDSNGDTAWTRTYASGEPEVNYAGNYVRQTSDGGYIIAGFKRVPGAMPWDPPTMYVLLIKTAANGDMVWTNTYGEEGATSWGYSVQQTTDDGYIITGFVGGGYAAPAEIILVKTDANGDASWTQTYSGDGSYEGYSVQQTTDGGYIVAGCKAGVGFPPPAPEALLIRTDPDGDTVWTRTYDCGSRALCIQLTDDGNYIVTGSKQGDDFMISNTFLMKVEGGEFTFGYDYLPGDVNMALGVWPPTVIGGDVTYLVGYFIGGGQESCLLDEFWCSADINGDCVIIGGDVTALVGYFVAGGDLVPCPDYEPLWPPVPEEAPDGWPNCDTPVINSRIIPTDSIE